MQGKSHSEEVWLKKYIYHGQGQQHKIKTIIVKKKGEYCNTKDEHKMEA